MTNKWQPIETAPKDGTHILLYAEKSVIEGWFYSSKGIRPNGTQYCREYWEIVRLSPHGCGCCSDELGEPTHWMPLPQPPEVEND